jgi:hypothetical protein
MNLCTLAGASVWVNCSPSRLKSWMNKGLIPDTRIQLGQIQARVIDLKLVPKLRRVMEGIEKEGLTVEGAFARYFNEEDVKGS